MRIGLVSDTGRVPFEALEPVCRAIRTQFRELAAAWGVHATVEARRDDTDGSLSYVKISAHPALLPPELTGQHRLVYGEIFAQVRYTAAWSVTASHECIEMAVNPKLRGVISGPPLDDYVAVAGVQRDEPVHYLREICDPCQSGAFAYAAPDSDPPVMVSDFVLPEYYERSARARRFSFKGAVRRSLQILPHGYLSWAVPRTKKLWQQWANGAGAAGRPECVGDWHPGGRGHAAGSSDDGGAGAGHPRANPGDPKEDHDVATLRELLYRADKSYLLRRIPDEKTIADVLAALKAPG